MKMNKKSNLSKENLPKTILAWALLAVAFVLGAYALQRLPFYPSDWSLYERVLASPQQAYDAYGFFNPPWAIWLLLPLRGLSSSAGVIRMVILVTFILLMVKRGADWTRLLMVASSMPLIYLVANANIDWIPALAFLMADHGMGLPFLLVKPQIGIFAALAWYRKQGASILIKSALLFGLSLLIHGWWPVEAFNNILEVRNGLTNTEWNVSFFPWSIPLGLWALYKTWQNSDELWGVSATLLLSPYLGFYSLTLWYALLVLRINRIWGWVVWALLWGLYILRNLYGVHWP